MNLANNLLYVSMLAGGEEWASEHVFERNSIVGCLRVEAAAFRKGKGKVTSCWACLVVLEPGVKLCPLCGADQSRPVAIVNPDAPPPVTTKSFLQHWGSVIVTMLLFAGSVTGIVWHYFGGLHTSPAAQAAEVAAKSLRDVRVELSAYSLFAKDEYPSTLDTLGGLASQSEQNALSAGYKLSYKPQPSSGGGAFRGFVLLARPENSLYLNLYDDESGVVRATVENRPATSQDPPF